MDTANTSRRGFLGMSAALLAGAALPYTVHGEPFRLNFCAPCRSELECDIKKRRLLSRLAASGYAVDRIQAEDDFDPKGRSMHCRSWLRSRSRFADLRPVVRDWIEQSGDAIQRQSSKDMYYVILLAGSRHRLWLHLAWSPNGVEPLYRKSNREAAWINHPFSYPPWVT